MRDLVSDVENLYWQLYYTYRNLNAKIVLRDAALRIWQDGRGAAGGQVGGGEDAGARERYFRAEADVQTALVGVRSERTGNVPFQPFNAGVHLMERRLRLLMGLPASDGRLIRPADEPTIAHVVFNWEEILAEAMMRRPELRRQKWQIQRRELELIASRNFLLPQLDFVGLYRFRGFGQRLLDSDRRNRARFDNAFRELTTGDFQEWQLGMEYRFPIGYRQGHAAVRNAQLQLARERAVLDAQEREVAHELATSVSEVERAHAVAKTNFNRRLAAYQRLAALKPLYDNAVGEEKTRIAGQLIDAQSTLSDAETDYFQSLVYYILALKDVHFSKGSLLDYNEVVLSEGAWPQSAYGDAARRERLRGRNWSLANFVMQQGPIVSGGPGGQQFGLPDNPSSGNFSYDAAPQQGNGAGGFFDGASESVPRPAPDAASAEHYSYPVEQPQVRRIRFDEPGGGASSVRAATTVTPPPDAYPDTGIRDAGIQPGIPPRPGDGSARGGLSDEPPAAAATSTSDVRSRAMARAFGAISDQPRAASSYPDPAAPVTIDSGGDGGP